MRSERARRAGSLASALAIGLDSVQRESSRFRRVLPWRRRMLFVRAVWKLNSVMYSKACASGIRTDTLYGSCDANSSSAEDSLPWLSLRRLRVLAVVSLGAENADTARLGCGYCVEANRLMIPDTLVGWIPRESVCKLDFARL
jgi:hypothetical protein